MKKILYLFVPVFLFTILGLFSYADDEPTYYPTGYSQMTFYTQTVDAENMKYTIVTGSQGQDIIAFKTSNTNQIKVCTSAYLKDNLSYPVVQQNWNWNGNEYVEGSTNSALFFLMYVNPNTPLKGGGIIFKDEQAALNYLINGSVEDGDISSGEFPDFPINWGDNDPNDVDNPWRPDTENIPAPQFEVVYDENGNVTNQIRFTNYIYNYSAGHGEERIYGLRMTIMWNTYGSFLFDHTGGLLSQEYKVTYSDLLVGDIDTVFAFPQRENEIVRCPQTFSFNTNQTVIDSFNDLLQTYDVDERSYNTNFSVSNDFTLTNKFKAFLERITCPYNTITFSVQYYRRMSDGTFHYGPWSTGKFTAPPQGAIFNANGVTLSGVGGMVQGNGGGLSGNDESGNWNNNWGNNTSDNLFNLSDLELDKVKANMTGLFSFFGEMPSFIQQCFLFLPDWVIAFIIACIVLVCAIGALKLALG